MEKTTGRHIDKEEKNRSGKTRKWYCRLGRFAWRYIAPLAVTVFASWLATLRGLDPFHELLGIAGIWYAYVFLSLGLFIEETVEPFIKRVRERRQEKRRIRRIVRKMQVLSESHPEIIGISKTEGR